MILFASVVNSACVVLARFTSDACIVARLGAGGVGGGRQVRGIHHDGRLRADVEFKVPALW